MAYYHLTSFLLFFLSFLFLNPRVRHQVQELTGNAWPQVMHDLAVGLKPR
jgi:hypothetical protein